MQIFIFISRSVDALSFELDLGLDFVVVDVDAPLRLPLESLPLLRVMPSQLAHLQTKYE